MNVPEQPNQRRYPRTPLSTLVQYRFNSLEEFIAEYSSNVSPGGIFVCAEDLPEVGAAVYLQFSLADGSRLIEGLGRVARIVEPGGKSPAGFGVEFVDFDEESLQLIHKLCQSKLEAKGTPP
jgi:uncharacterized protein (TIGR02266 family)